MPKANPSLSNVVKSNTANHERNPDGGLSDGAGSGSSSGLVHIQQVTEGDLIEIDTSLARIQRMQRSVITTSRLLTEFFKTTRQQYRPAMVTLTYRPGVEWEAKHITGLNKNVREWARTRGVVIPYVWVAELQQRGAVHYHVLVWLPVGYSLPKPDKRGWWPHGSTRIEWAKNAVGYLAKYASKGDSKAEFPKGLRLSGFGGISQAVRLERRWWMMPSYMREDTTPAQDWIRASGGGWVSRESGEWVPSAFGLVSASRGRVIVLRLTDALRAMRARR